MQKKKKKKKTHFAIKKRIFLYCSFFWLAPSFALHFKDDL
jgi:hypothetical protein